ncbi:MAG: hypothetical protein WKG07_07255 [Hymenobacter sp.]
MTPALKTALGKVPAVTLGFWVIKIAATTLGETAGDAVTMSMNLGYLTGSVIFAAILCGGRERADCSQALSPVSVLGRYRGDYHFWYHAGRFF